MSTPPERLEALRRLYAELSLELGRQALLEEALRQARDRMRLERERRLEGLVPHVWAHDPHAEVYLEAYREAGRAHGAEAKEEEEAP